MGDIRIKDMPEVNMKNKRITELLEQIQKDFQTSSENIGKIKGLLEDEDKGITIEFPSLKPGRKFHIINDSDREVTVEGNPNGTVTIKPGETKKFPEPLPEINSYADAVNLVCRPYSNSYILPDNLYKKVHNFEKRLVIAEALGARPFEFGCNNYTIRRLSTGYDVDCYSSIDFGCPYFQTKDQAQKYLEICLNGGLL